MLRFLCLCPGGRLTEQLADALIRSPLSWELEEVRSIPEAEQRILENDFAVVVVDASSDEVERVAFLRSALRRNPELTPFLIVSSDAVFDRSESLQGINLLYLPIDISELLCIAQRTQSLRDVLSSDRVFRTVAKIKQLPTCPRMFQEISKLLESEHCSYGQLAAVIRRDPSIAALVLQSANSSFYSMARQISSVEQAISVLGLANTKNLVMAIEVMGSLCGDLSNGIDLNALWNHSYEVGERASRIVREVFALPALAEAAFAAGLLHDIGKVVLARDMGSQWTEAKLYAQERSVSLYEAERGVIGAHHGEIGAFLLSLWNLPAAIVEAVAFHHDPEPPPSARPSVVTAVFVANQLTLTQRGAQTLGCDPSGVEYLRHLGYSDDVSCWEPCAQGGGGL